MHVAFASSCRSTSWHSSLDDTRMEPISTTGNLKIGVSVQLPNPSGFVGQRSGPETNLRAALAEGNEKQVFFVRFSDKENMLFGGVKASGSGYGPLAGKTVSACVA